MISYCILQRFYNCSYIRFLCIHQEIQIAQFYRKLKTNVANCLEFTPKPILRLFYIYRTSSIVCYCLFSILHFFVLFEKSSYHQKKNFIFGTNTIKFTFYFFYVTFKSCQSNLDKLWFVSPTFSFVHARLKQANSYRRWV